MQILVRTTASTLTLDVEPSDSVATLKAKIQARSGVAVHQQRLTFSGSPLRDSRAISTYHIEKASTLHLNGRLHGGCPPKQCFCCDIYEGVRSWTLVFAVLLIILAILAIVKFITNIGRCARDASGGAHETHASARYCPQRRLKRASRWSMPSFISLATRRSTRATRLGCIAFGSGRLCSSSAGSASS